MNLANQKVLITGAAGLIGSAVAKKAFDAGATVLLTDISDKGLSETTKNISNTDHPRLVSIVSDITLPENIDSIINEFNQKTGGINCAVHCAYPRSPGWGNSLERLQIENLNYDLTKQLGGAIIFSQKILKHFEKNNGGSLVHISSIQGVRAPKFDHYEGTNMSSPVEYAAIKAGIISITSWLAKYYTNRNIRVNCVSPGGILDKQPKTFLEKYRNSCCNIGMLQPEHIAASVAYLLSTDAFAINGQNIIVDDGWSL